MKKLSIVLLIISIITLIIIFLMVFAWGNDGSRRSYFLLQWSLICLFPFIIPLMGGNMLYHLIIKNPRIWFKVYGVIVLVWILVQVLVFSFIEKTMDLPLCINRNYSTTTITVQTVSTNKNTQTIQAGRNMFKLESKEFNPVTRGKAYRITYLPNIKYVIDIVDDDTGNSLLKKR